MQLDKQSDLKIWANIIAMYGALYRLHFNTLTISEFVETCP